MDLEEVLMGSELLFDDKTGYRFGENLKYTILGYFIRNKGRKYYVLSCDVCKMDTELNGDGVFHQEFSKIHK